jgi:hypothetical protein
MLRTLKRNGKDPSAESGNAEVTEDPISEGSSSRREERSVEPVFDGRVG